jgi:hypothetical protein
MSRVHGPQYALVGGAQERLPGLSFMDKLNQDS